MTEAEKQAQIKLIDHLLLALCTCELTEKGREYLKQYKAKLNDSNGITNKTTGGDRDRTGVI